MNDAGEQAPPKVKPPRRRQQLTAVLVGEIIKSTTPAPIDDVFQAIRNLVDSGLIDPEDGLIRQEFASAKAVRSKKAQRTLREAGLSKSEVQALRDELGVSERRDKGERDPDDEEDDSEES